MEQADEAADEKNFCRILMAQANSDVHEVEEAELERRRGKTIRLVAKRERVKLSKAEAKAAAKKKCRAARIAMDNEAARVKKVEQERQR